MFTAWSFWPWMIMRRMWQLWDVRANRPIMLCTRMHSKDFCDLTWSCLGRESFIIRPDLPWPLLSTDMTLKARGWGGGYWLSCSLGCRVQGEGVGGGYGPVMVSEGTGLWWYQMCLRTGHGHLIPVVWDYGHSLSQRWDHTPWQTILQTPLFPLLITSDISFW